MPLAQLHATPQSSAFIARRLTPSSSSLPTASAGIQGDHLAEGYAAPAATSGPWERVAAAMPEVERRPPRAPPVLVRQGGIESVERRAAANLAAVNPGYKPGYNRPKNTDGACSSYVADAAAAAISASAMAAAVAATPTPSSTNPHTESKLATLDESSIALGASSFLS